MIQSNTIYRGDNLAIMQEMPDAFVDLCYIDPPFFTQKDYKNIWGDKESVLDYENVQSLNGFKDTKDFFERHIHSGAKGLNAYLEWMRMRLVEIYRILKPTGSFYCHLDYHAVHYVKIMLDEIFNYKNFRNEITWKRTVGGKNTTKNQLGVITDTILFYSKGKNWTFNIQYKNYDSSYIKSHYYHEDLNGRKYRLDNLTAPSYNPNTLYEYKGYKPPKNGWRWTKEKMIEMDKKEYIYFPKNKNSRLSQIRYLDEQKGIPFSNLWDDIPPINSQAKEDTGWPTQKPVILLERIIKTSSNEGDLVFDCFAGCGTSMHAAHNLKRKWIGIDISPTAVDMIKKRFNYNNIEYNLIDINHNKEVA